MCGFVEAAFVGSTLFSAFGQVQAGRAADRAGRMDEKQYENQRLRAKAETDFATADRMREAMEVSSQNRLAFAMTGLTEASFEGIMRGNRETVRRDLDMIARGGRSRDVDLRIAGANARAEGSAAKRAATFGAISTLAQGAFQYETQRSPGSPGASGATPKSTRSLVSLEG